MSLDEKLFSAVANTGKMSSTVISSRNVFLIVANSRKSFSAVASSGRCS